MNKKWLVFGLAILALVGGVITGRQWTTGYQFHETTLNAEEDVLRDLGTRITLKVNTTSQEGLLGVVGLVLIVDKEQAAKGNLVFDRSDVIPTLRPEAEAILVAPTNKTLYEGKVSNTLDAGGAYTAFSGKLASNQAAEMLIIDELYMGFRDRTKIPYEALYKLQPPEGKAYFFVEGATLTSTTYRTYDEVSSSGALEGAAFKANGKVYASSKGFAYTSTLAVDVFDIQALKPAEAGGGDRKEILTLYRQHVKGDLDKGEADEFVGLLKIASKDKDAVAGAELTSFGQ